MIRANKAEGATDEARRLAEQERDTAIAARKETFDALIDLTSNEVVVGNLLAQKSVTQKANPQEREFFGRVVARFERLAAALPDTAETQAMRGKCLLQVANGYFYLGDFPQALAAYQRATDLYRGLHDRSPDDPVAAGAFIRCLHSVSVTYDRLGRPEDRDRLFHETMPLAEQFHDRFPDNGEITQTLAFLYENRAAYSKNLTAGLSDINRAIDLMEKEVGRGREGTSYLAIFLASRVLALRRTRRCGEGPGGYGPRKSALSTIPLG